MFAELLRRKLGGICELSDEQVERLLRHYELLVRWNRVLNLTSIRRLEEAVERHYCESIFAACHLPEDSISIVDVGSGAGFPGIPIAVVRPASSVTLIESHQRKAVFLREASRDLENVRVIVRRVEDIGERFDWVVSRGVGCGELAGVLKQLGRNAELLIGEVRLVGLAGFEWQQPIRLPWGERRYLWIGTDRDFT